MCRPLRCSERGLRRANQQRGDQQSNDRDCVHCLLSGKNSGRLHIQGIIKSTEYYFNFLTIKINAMDLNLPPQISRAIVLSLGVTGVLLFWFGAPNSAGLQVVATLALTASFVFCVLPGSLRRSRDRQAQRGPRKNSAEKWTPRVFVASVLWLYLLWMVIHLAYDAFSGVNLAIAERAWASTDATVVSTSVGEGHTKRRSYWYGVLTYFYAVGGTSYVGTGHDMYFTSQPSAEDLATARPPGYHLTAYYDRNNPQKTTRHLRKSFVDRIALSMFVLMFCLLISPFVALGKYAMRSRRWSSL
jgi:uncharacterized membrane protein YhaH (DUF805 family)